MLAESTDVVGNTFVSIVRKCVWWRICAAVAHAVRGDDVEAEGGEEGNLVAPAERDVGEAMDEDDGASVGGRCRARRVDVAIGFAVEVGGAQLDAGVVEGFELVGIGHDGAGIAEEGVEQRRRGGWGCGRRNALDV